MSEKKRKMAAEDGGRPAKKQAQGPSKSKLRVDLVAGSEVAKPIIAVTPGGSLPPTAEFQSFVKKFPDGSSSLLLHSSTHPTIDFNAVEGDSSTDKYLKHYVAVFDPTANILQVTEAKKLTVRSCVRQREPENDSDEDTGRSKATTNYSTRAALTHAFGTKKSKKAVQASAENRLLTQTGDDANNPLSSAILSSMPSPEPSEEIPSSPRAHKPLPMANLTTHDINDVYPMSSLVFPDPSVLEEMPIAYWRENAKKKKPISTMSRFVSDRVFYLASALEANPSNAGLLEKVQLLRYILLLFEFYIYLSRLPRFKKTPPVSAWPNKTVSGNISHEILSKMLGHFAPGGTGLGKNETTLLQSTILALTLHIPPPSFNAGANLLVSDTSDIQMDLAMTPEQVRKLYKELGCKIESPKPAELERWGLQKKESKDKKKEGPGSAARAKVAKLSFPLEFPSLSSGRPQQRKR